MSVFREFEVSIGRHGYGISRDRQGLLRFSRWLYQHRRFGLRVETR